MKSASVLFHWYSADMTTDIEVPAAANARSLLLPYTLALLAAMVLVQATIALTGGEVGVLAASLTALVAVGLAVWLQRTRRRLEHVRFGVVVAHAIAFVTVTTSFNVHAVVRMFAIGSDGGLDAAAQDLLATPWFGATLVMSAAWGLGLLVHLVGSVLGRGWED